MKNFLRSSLVMIISVLALGANAQNLQYTPSQHVSGTISEDITEYNIAVSTENHEDITYQWERIENTFLMGWDYSLCDHGHCFAGIPESGKMLRISQAQSEGGQKGYFKLNFLTYNAIGKGVVKIYVYDSADYSRGDTISFTLDYSESASISNLSDNSVKFMPNPANNEVRFITQESYSNMIISDVQGRIVKMRYGLNAGTHQMNVGDLPSGVYLLRLSSDGIIRQSKLVIQH